MTAQDMIAELNANGFTDEDSITKVRVLQHTVWDLEGREPWPFVEATATLNYDGTNPVASNFPADFRAALSLKNLSTGRRVRPVRSDEFDEQVGTDGSQAGDALMYYFDGLQLKVWPVPPTSNGTYRLRYLKWSPAISDTSLETDFLIPKYFHRLIVYGALWKLYDMEDDPELATRYEQHYENGIQQMKAALWQRQFDRPDHVLMNDPDDYIDYDGWTF